MDHAPKISSPTIICHLTAHMALKPNSIAAYPIERCHVAAPPSSLFSRFVGQRPVTRLDLSSPHMLALTAFIDKSISWDGFGGG